MSKVIRFGLLTALMLAVIAALTCATWAGPSNPYSSTLVSALGGYSDDLVATVTEFGGVYHYEYELAFSDSYLVNADQGIKAPLTTFSVGNLLDLEFVNAGNDGGLLNPVHGVTSLNSVLWKNGTVPVGTTVKFWFDSPHPYQEVGVTMQGGRVASGTTLGMVPEPTTMATVMLGIAGFGGTLLRRHRRL
jgi:hypothetical protein